VSIVSKIQAARSAGTSASQRELLRAIADLTARRDGLRPTVRELAQELGTGMNDVYQKLVRLERDGLVERTPGACRSVRVARQPNGAKH
jgi:DNA-binding MarR family transcriptional regulator